MGICVAALIAVLAPAVAPAHAKAVTPVLEFVPTSAFPISFTAEGGEVTAAMDEFETVVHCADSEGEGEVIGPRSALSKYVFKGCEAVDGDEDGAQCKSEGASEKEIRTGTIEANLVYIDQAKHEVGMLLNPSGGIYMEFKCGGESVKARGSFLSPVGPINEETTSFTASLSRSDATQVPSEYENAIGEKRPAIPMGEREGHEPATTGVELSFAITTSAPLEIKAVTAAEIEAKQHEDEAAAAAALKKRQDEEAATAAAAKKRQEEEAAAAAAARKRQEEEVKLERLRRARLLSKGLTQCRKAQSKPRRVRCERRVKKKYGGQRGTKK